MSGYDDFALFYDRLTENVDYKSIASAIDNYVLLFGGKRGSAA